MCQSEYLRDSIRRLNANFTSYFMRKGSMTHERIYEIEQRNRHPAVDTTVW